MRPGMLAPRPVFRARELGLEPLYLLRGSTPELELRLGSFKRLCWISTAQSMVALTTLVTAILLLTWLLKVILEEAVIRSIPDWCLIKGQLSRFKRDELLLQRVWVLIDMRDSLTLGTLVDLGSLNNLDWNRRLDILILKLFLYILWWQLCFQLHLELLSFRLCGLRLVLRPIFELHVYDWLLFFLPGQSNGRLLKFPSQPATSPRRITLIEYTVCLWVLHFLHKWLNRIKLTISVGIVEPVKLSAGLRLSVTIASTFAHYSLTFGKDNSTISSYRS